MLDEWDHSRRIREFVREYERRLPDDARTEVSTRWTESVLALAERLDPLNQVNTIAKEMDSSDEVLARLVEEAAVVERAAHSGRS